jgi:hypothetical protein
MLIDEWDEIKEFQKKHMIVIIGNIEIIEILKMLIFEWLNLNFINFF